MCLYLFCIYKPCKVNAIENVYAYDNVLAEISVTCRNNDTMYICIDGDVIIVNTAFDREQAWQWHTRYLKQFMSQENIICGAGFIKSRVDYGYCNAANTSYSVIDLLCLSHFLYYC